MIQLIFDKNLESPDLIEIFNSDDAHQFTLDEKLLVIMDEKVSLFNQIHTKQ